MVITAHLSLKDVVSVALEILEFEIAPSTMCTITRAETFQSKTIVYLPHGPVQYDSIEQLVRRAFLDS